jgi:hypothetical protein
MNDHDEDLLDAIARQARVAYATQQLNECSSAVEHWQKRIEHDADVFNYEGLEHQLNYYVRQAERWQSYLAILQQDEPYSNVHYY